MLNEMLDYDFPVQSIIPKTFTGLNTADNLIVKNISNRE